jgi:cyanate lyase
MTNGIGHNSQPKVSNVNSLSANDKQKLKGAIQELNDSMTRAAAERELQKETINKMAEDLGLDKKLIRRLGKAYFKANFGEEVESNNTFEEFYEGVLK